MSSDGQTLSTAEMEATLQTLQEIQEICMPTMSPVLSSQQPAQEAIQKKSLEAKKKEAFQKQTSKQTSKCRVCGGSFANPSSNRRHFQSRHGGPEMKLVLRAEIYVDKTGKYHILMI